MQRFSVRQAIASYLGEDSAAVEIRRYQPTRTPCPVYVADNEYITATGSTRTPRESDDHHFGTWKWTEVEDPGRYCKAMGWHIWQADRS